MLLSFVEEFVMLDKSFSFKETDLIGEKSITNEQKDDYKEEEVVST